MATVIMLMAMVHLSSHTYYIIYCLYIVYILYIYVCVAIYIYITFFHLHWHSLLSWGPETFNLTLY